jgi:hypothetical protein
MSDPKPVSVGARRLVEDSIAEHEVDRIAGLSEEELHAEMKRDGLEPGAGKALLEGALAALNPKPSAKVTSLDDARRRRWVRPTWLLVAAMLAVTVGIAGANVGTIVAYFSPPETPGRGIERTPEEIAATVATVRRDAFDDCNRGDFKDCTAKLDEAKRLDPAGEVQGPVRLARAQVLRAIAFHDCDMGYGPRCKDELDEAKALDPAGETTNRVQQARADILAMSQLDGGRVWVKP